MPYNRPQSMYRQQRGALAGYQYRNMNRYVPTQIRSWSKANGNPYTLAQWRQATPPNVANKAYFDNVLMQRLGGDWSLMDRMMGNSGQYGEGWKNAPTWQPNLQGWAKSRLQGGSDYLLRQNPDTYKPSARDAILAQLGALV
jgi:hypothetical protein